MIGIIIAMPQELEPYKKNIEFSEKHYGKEFYFGKIGQKNIIICLSGIGKVNAAFATTLMIQFYKPELIISTGVSGGLGKTKPFDIIVATKVVQHDVDTTALGDAKGMVSTLNKIYFETSPKYSEAYLKEIKEVKTGIIACGDQFIADKRRTEEIVKDFSAIACDMESGAIAQVAFITSTDLVILRGITDDANNKAVTDFYERLHQISAILYNTVSSVIEKL